MDTIKLPQLERIVFQQTSCKNKIKQLIAPEMDFTLSA